MNTRTLIPRARGWARRAAKRAELDVRKRRRDDLFVDYGWMRLLYTGDGDAQELYYHLHQKAWREQDLAVLRNLLAPEQTAVDVGANLGFMTTILSSIVGPRGRIVSLEPSPPVFAKLQKTIAANDLHNVVALNLGCGAAESVERLRTVSGSSGNASLVGNGASGPEIKVRRLDDVAEVWEHRVNFVKIDVEGYEPQVLTGAERLLEAHRPILYLEMGGEYLDSTRESVAILEAAGYGVDHVRSLDWSEVGNGSNFFFLPRP